MQYLSAVLKIVDFHATILRLLEDRFNSVALCLMICEFRSIFLSGSAYIKSSDCSELKIHGSADLRCFDRPAVTYSDKGICQE